MPDSILILHCPCASVPPGIASTHKAKAELLAECHKKRGRAALQPLQPGAPASSQLPVVTCEADKQSTSSCSLALQAQYFADLDAEALIEDDQDREACGSQPAANSQAGDTDFSAQQKCHASGASTHIQTPDAVALAKYHPELQVHSTLALSDCAE